MAIASNYPLRPKLDENRRFIAIFAGHQPSPGMLTTRHPLRSFLVWIRICPDFQMGPKSHSNIWPSRNPILAKPHADSKTGLKALASAQEKSRHTRLANSLAFTPS